MPSGAEGRPNKKIVPGILVRGPIVRTSGCRLLLVSVISPALGPTKSFEPFPSRQLPCRDPHEGGRNLVAHSLTHRQQDRPE